MLNRDKCVQRLKQTLTPSTSAPAIFRSSLVWFLQCSHVQSKWYCAFSSLRLSSDKFMKSTYATVSSSPSSILPKERSSILRKRNTVYYVQSVLVGGEILFHSVAFSSVNPGDGLKEWMLMKINSHISQNKVWRIFSLIYCSVKFSLFDLFYCFGKFLIYLHICDKPIHI